ncbi:hypothetical protein CRUP_013942 [Coryphaenoides rupestris]|nr:hypothetical protein CRUP_013942 [Coryphaenoides rupestris]
METSEGAGALHVSTTVREEEKVLVRPTSQPEEEEAVGMRGRELLGGVGKTMLQSGGTFGTFMAIGMGIRC